MGGRKRRKYHSCYAVQVERSPGGKVRYLEPSPLEPHKGPWTNWIGWARLYGTRDEAERAAERYNEREHEAWERDMIDGIRGNDYGIYKAVEVRYAISELSEGE